MRLAPFLCFLRTLETHRSALAISFYIDDILFPAAQFCIATSDARRAKVFAPHHRIVAMPQRESIYSTPLPSLKLHHD